VDIILLLLSHGGQNNFKIGKKLNTLPLAMAAANGHTGNAKIHIKDDGNVTRFLRKENCGRKTV